MDIIDDRKVIIQPLNKFWYLKKVAAIDMLRLDLLHPVVSGNKWYKLRLNMAHATDNGYKTVITFGGGFSNHLIATACMARKFGLASVGIVRGQHDKLTPTLEACMQEGMQLIFVTHDEYKHKQEPGWLAAITRGMDKPIVIPEGGANEWGRAGAGLLSRFVNDSYTHIILSVGTGTTLAGLRNKLDGNQQVMGFVPMKQGAYLKDEIAGHLLPEKNKNWQLFDTWHLGGFGKWTAPQLTFMNDFYELNKIPLDIVYTSKMMMGIQDLLTDNFFNTCDRLLCIHTGGVQGNASVKGELVY